MTIAFYIDELNLRGVTNSTFLFAYYNQKILKNRSIVFYNKKNLYNDKNVLIKFKNKIKTIGISKFSQIETLKKKFDISYIYVQKSGQIDRFVSNKIKTLIHAVFPQHLKEVHGYRYTFISSWLSKKFSNGKINFIPLIVRNKKQTGNLKKRLKIKKNQIVLGCHGGRESFDLSFVKDAIFKIVSKRDDIVFLFLNIEKFTSHPQVIFLDGTSNEVYKSLFLNTCDMMLYGRSLGESFGLACGEFALLGKKIISYKFNLHKSHKFYSNKKKFIEYSSFVSLMKILNKLKKEKKINIKNTRNAYLHFTPEKVMNKFKQVFLEKEKTYNLTIHDKVLSYFGHIEILYNYIRHKIYIHYYNYVYSKFIKH